MEGPISLTPEEIKILQEERAAIGGRRDESAGLADILDPEQLRALENINNKLAQNELAKTLKRAGL